MMKGLHYHDEQLRTRPIAPAVQQRHEATSSASLQAPVSVRPRVPKRWLCLSFAVLLLGLGFLYGLHLWQYYQHRVSTDDAYVVGDIVPISARVSGTVLAVHGETHQQVEAGQLLVQLDQRDFATQVQLAEAAVEVATSRLHQAELEVVRERQSTDSDTVHTSAMVQAAQRTQQEAQHAVDAARARLRAHQAAVAVAQAEIDMQVTHLDMARTVLTRQQQLLADGVVAQQRFDEAASTLRGAEAARRISHEKLTQAQREVERVQIELRMRQQAAAKAQAQVAAAQARLVGAQSNQQSVSIKQAQVETARALLKQAQANLVQAQWQLAYTTIRAPMAGVIAKKAVESGKVIKTGQPLFALVPQQDVWVEANFKETQLHRMQPGQPVTLQVDAYPNRVLHGAVASIGPGTGSIFSLLPPENATGNFVKVVQRVPVKIVLVAASPDGLVLRPGMSVIATVNTQ